MTMTVPLLDRPGAGLPFLERVFARHLAMRLLRKKYAWDDAAALCDAETARIMHMVDSVGKVPRAKRVLIPRQMGLEDSSRYWSVDMTLEHMMIVARGVCDVIVTLSRGEHYTTPVRIEDVKPKGDLDGDALALFAAHMAGVRPYLADHVIDRASTTTHDHPWFGPMTAHEWHILLGVHQRIHRRQIAAIIARL